MSWILTATGRRIELARPSAKPINITDIATGLAQANLLSGQARRPYSAAEHALLVSELADREYRLDAQGQLCALLHNAHTAYLGPVDRRVCLALGDAWFALERRHTLAVVMALDLQTTLRQRDAIKQCDLRTEATARRDLLPPAADHDDPPYLRGIEPISWTSLGEDHLSQHGWEFWRARFIDRFQELAYARSLQIAGCSRHEPGQRAA